MNAPSPDEPLWWDGYRTTAIAEMIEARHLFDEEPAHG